MNNLAQVNKAGDTDMLPCRLRVAQCNSSLILACMVRYVVNPPPKNINTPGFRPGIRLGTQSGVPGTIYGIRPGRPGIRPGTSPDFKPGIPGIRPGTTPGTTPVIRPGTRPSREPPVRQNNLTIHGHISWPLENTLL